MRTKRATISGRIGGRERRRVVNASIGALIATVSGATVSTPAGAAEGAVTAPALAPTVDIRVGKEPVAVVVNPKTNKIYVANKYSKSVSVIDGKTNKTTTVTTGIEPYAIGINQLTNKIYVACQRGADAKGNVDPNANGSVTVIDGATNKTTSLPAQLEPSAVAINEKTNKIYVTNEGSNELTVIDGKTNKTATIELRKNGAPINDGVLSPHDVRVNTLTNKIYVTGPQSNTVAVVDGATNKFTTVVTENGPKTGFTPTVAGVNPKTNKIYVSDFTTNDVTVIDGKTNKITAIAIPPEVQDPVSLAVNPNTNKIYVANLTSKSITVIDGATQKAFTIGDLPGKPHDVSINLRTNKIYFPTFMLYRGNQVGNDRQITGVVEVLDGATNTLTTVVTGNGPVEVAVNENTNKAYVANQYSDSVTVVTESPTSGSKDSAGKASVVSTSAVSAVSRPAALSLAAALPPVTRSRVLHPMN